MSSHTGWRMRRALACMVALACLAAMPGAVAPAAQAQTVFAPASDLVLEISESESIENFGIFREVSDSCREVGVRIAIDDAGTGYASLEAIMEITPDFIKTDIGLVRGIDSDPPRQEVVRALASVARGIGAQVIAEGIETDAELRALRELGVRYGQGFYFGAALTSDGKEEQPEKKEG